MKHIVKPTLAVLCILLLSSCVAIRPKNKETSDRSQIEILGPPIPPQGVSAPPTQEGPIGPEPDAHYQIPKDSIVLVLGPGLARGVAYVGAIKALEEAHQNVSAVLGVEIGALVATIWGSSSVNTLEWEIHKLNRDVLLDRSLWKVNQKIADGNRLLAFLEKSTKVTVLEKMKTPTFIYSSVLSGNASAIVAESNGSVKDIVRGAMAVPALIKAHSYDGKERSSAAIQMPVPAAQAKTLGLGLVVCLDVLGNGSAPATEDHTEITLAAQMRAIAVVASSQLRDCDAVIHIDAGDVGYLDFTAKADLIYKGKTAVQKWLESRK